MATNINGLIYYKLDAELHGYSGDITKNCGLRGEEIDGNFNFLRGNDVESISFDENGTMFIKKFNGELLSASQIEKPEKPEYDFTYNPDNGVLTIITPNGNEVKLEGFNIAMPTPSSVYHDNTLVGNGSKESILRLNNISKTGRYLPAIKLVDLTSDETLPISNNALHDRYVTKEYVSHFGRLYPLNGMLKIQEKLKELNSEWRIPSKEDWDKILNLIDCEKPNHDDTSSNVELGASAGSILKGVKYWKEKDGIILSQDNYNFNILPVGYCGNRGKQFYGSFGESTAYWTPIVEDSYNDMYVKCFNYDKETVGQHTWGENYYLSIRLVKDFNGNNYNSSETINGFTVNCVHIPGSDTIWTSENISFSQEEYDSFVPDEWLEIMENDKTTNSSPYRFFVNDWNGEKWEKHEIKDGESIVIHENENGNMHEWVIVNGELVDTIGLVLNHTNDILDNLNESLNNEISDRKAECSNLLTAINNEKDERIQSYESLENSINELNQNLSQNVESLRNDLNNEISTRVNENERLSSELANEKLERENSDTQIKNDIESEKTERLNAEQQLQESIENEKKEREESDLKETENRISTDNLLQKLINENKLVIENNTIVIVPGYTDESGNTTPTTIKVNIDPNCEHMKLGENGIYFDGNLGQF